MSGPVLVVDGDPSVCCALSAILSLYGAAHEIASDGEQALRAIARKRPSLIVLDLKLPKLGGLSVVRRLHAMGEAVPTVIMTTGPENLAQYVVELGLAGCLYKPFTVDEILAFVNHFIA